MLIILFHIHSFFFKKAKKFKCLYQNRSADLADGLFLELCFHVGGDTNFFDYGLIVTALMTIYLQQDPQPRVLLIKKRSLTAFAGSDF